MSTRGKNSTSNEVPIVTFEDDRTPKKGDEKVCVKTIEIVRKTNEYINPKNLKLADFDVKANGFAENQTCPLYRSYSSENFMTARFDPKCPMQVTTKILSNGIKVCYKNNPEITERYTFFAHSASQLRSRVCILYNNRLEKAEDIINKFGDFDKIKTVAKRAARIGLLLSTAGETVKLREDDISRIDDVERDGYTFTDGCGYISPVLAEKITEHLKISEKYKHQKHPYPSVFQVRLLGCKGVLALKPSLEKGVEVRKSMEKFKWLLPAPFPLGVVDKGYSRPYEVGSLNMQFILLLSALGIKDEVFLEKQKTYFLEIKSLTRNKETAFTYLCAFGEIEIAEQLLKSGSLDDKSVLAKVKSIQQKAYKSPHNSESELEKTKKSPALRLKIPIEKSRNVYGVSDPSENDLKYGTCFFQPTVRGETKPIVGKVVVAKNPCYSPGDVRVLDCVDKSCCHHLVDCIVFPTDGKRPHPDEIAGSDLDGDKFFVCWDPDLVPYESQDPDSYRPADVSPQKDIEQKDLMAYFARYSNSTVGKLNSLFVHWADRKGVASTECQEISALFSTAIDSAKTGEKVTIPKHLEIRRDDKQSHGNFVWHRMVAEAELFLEKQVTNPEIYDKDRLQLTEETVRSILANELISVSDYQLFRFLCKWAEHEGISEEQLSNMAKECIDFTTFSLIELRRAQIDCPGLSREILLNPFVRSKILSDVDCKDLIPQTSDYYIRYSLVFRASAEDLSWDILNNVLTSALAKVLVFKFIIGSVEWVCVLDMPQQLQSRETLEVNEAEHSLPRAFLFIHQDKVVSERFTLDSTYSFSLYDQRLQIYQGTKTRTFVSFNVNDANDLSIVSIDLQRFDKRLSNKLGGIRVRKEAFVSLEVYCHDPNGEPIPKIHFTESPTAIAPTQPDETTGSQFRSVKEDFPDLGDEYSGIYLEADEEMHRLQNLQNNGSLKAEDFNVFRNLLEKMNDSLERHEWACKLESLVEESGIIYGDVDQYQTLLVYLLEGLKKSDSRVITCSKINITLLRRLQRVLDRMRKNNVHFSVENVLQLFEILLFVHDYQTSVFLVHLFKEEVLPMSREEFSSHENSYAYFIHWSSLLYLEVLEEIKEQEQVEMISTRKSVVCEGKVSIESDDDDKNKPGCTIFVKNSEINFSVGDYLALSPTNARSAFREREYIMEVKSCAGKHLYADAVWPSSKDVLDELSSSPAWKISSFPNLVSFNRMLEAIKKLCSQTPLENAGIFRELLNTWNNTAEDREANSENEHQGPNESAPERRSVDTNQKTTFRQAIESSCSDNAPPDGRSSSLNPSQVVAVKQACNSPLTLIQGPPGTGKSKTSANIIKEFLHQNPEEKILAVAETNEGVDNLLEKIVEVSNDIPESQVLRVGSATWTVRDNLKKFTLESRYAELSEGKRVRENRMDKKTVKKVLCKARIVCTTCISAGSKIFDGVKFPKLLVDEASQATEPAILVPVCRGSDVLVLVGDDKQLPPTVKNQAAEELGKTTFSRLRAAGHPVYLLDTQYRMHPCISEFPSITFYGGKLKNGVGERDRQIPKGFSWPNSTKPLAFVATPKDVREQGGRSKKNIKEGEIVKRVVDDVLRAGDLKEEDIGIVTPYSAQVKVLTDEIQKHHRGISIRTVDGFQGQERELIIFSAVRSNDVGQLGFLDHDQRMNVLLTRARRGLIVIGQRDTLAKKDSTWNKWIEWMKKEKLEIDTEFLFPSSSNGSEKTTGRGGRGEARRSAPGSSSGRGT